MSIDTTPDMLEIEAMVRGAVVPVVDDVFTAMVTGEPGLVWEVGPGTFTFAEPIHTWVSMTGTTNARALLTMERTTADEIARAFLDLGEGEEMTDEDFLDAIGELANVVGGNLKSLLPGRGVMTLPTVDTQPPTNEIDPFHVAELDWMGKGIRISLWHD